MDPTDNIVRIVHGDIRFVESVVPLRILLLVWLSW